MDVGFIIMPTKSDLVITAACGYQHWEQIRHFVVSLENSGFEGDIVVLVDRLAPFVIDCLRNRGCEIVPFATPPGTPFVVKGRFEPLLKFLGNYAHKYRYILWADVSDVIFQSNPSTWLTAHAPQPGIIAARECWRVQDELQFNTPWVQATTPDAYDWLKEKEILCGGTVAGRPRIIYNLMTRIYQMVCENPKANDQAALNYLLHSPYAADTLIPTMKEGWVATCSAFKTEGFESLIGRPASELTDEVPIFDLKQGLVLTPDGSKPFVMVHQFNRDIRWCQIVSEKYKW